MKIYNNNAFDRLLKRDGSELTFWLNDANGTVTYGETTQLASYPGTVATEFADVQEFTVYEKKNLAGIINVDSKKIIVSVESTLQRGDKLLNAATLQEEYYVEEVRIFANRKHLIANKVQDDPKTYS